MVLVHETPSKDVFVASFLSELKLQLPERCPAMEGLKRMAKSAKERYLKLWPLAEITGTLSDDKKYNRRLIQNRRSGASMDVYRKVLDILLRIAVYNLGQQNEHLKRVLENFDQGNDFRRAPASKRAREPEDERMSSKKRRAGTPSAPVDQSKPQTCDAHSGTAFSKEESDLTKFLLEDPQEQHKVSHQDLTNTSASTLDAPSSSCTRTESLTPVSPLHQSKSQARKTPSEIGQAVEEGPSRATINCEDKQEQNGLFAKDSYDFFWMVHEEDVPEDVPEDGQSQDSSRTGVQLST